MLEWWEQVPAEKIVDHFTSGPEDQSSLFSTVVVRMHITHEEILAKVRAVVLRAEVADRWEQKTLYRVAQRPYQFHELRIPNKVLRKNREVYAMVIGKLIGLGVVWSIKAN